MQHQRLAQEMQDIAEARLVNSKPKMKASRSLPAMVMKPSHKPRVSSTLYLQLSYIQRVSVHVVYELGMH